MVSVVFLRRAVVVTVPSPGSPATALRARLVAVPATVVFSAMASTPSTNESSRRFPAASSAGTIIPIKNGHNMTYRRLTMIPPSQPPHATRPSRRTELCPPPRRAETDLRRPIHWACKAQMGTSTAVRSHQRPGDGASPGVCTARRSPRSRRKNGPRSPSSAR